MLDEWKTRVASAAEQLQKRRQERLACDLSARSVRKLADALEKEASDAALAESLAEQSYRKVLNE
jgi:hypothetical protein